MDFEVRHIDGTSVKLISNEHKCAITSATQTRKLCGNDTVTINLVSATYIEFYVGDKIAIFGTTYTMNQLPTVKKESERHYEYTLVFEGLQYTLIDRVFLMPDNTQGDNLMFDLAGMLDVLDDNINRGNTGKQYEFVLDESLEETEYKNLSLTGKNCLQVLQQLCQEWDTEFVFAEESTRIAIYIGVAGSTFPATFKYGRGGAVYELNREKGSTDIVTRLFAYGGTQNLTYYRHNRLCLPNKTKNQSYVENTTAQTTYGIKEQVKNFDDIYPNRIGTITSLSGCDYNEFIDTSMNFDLNERWANTDAACTEWLALKGLENTTQNRNIYFNDVAGTATRYLMQGATAKIHFNTGALAGYECDLHAYTHGIKKFELKPLVDENGYDFPSKTNTAFKLAVGDEYVILDINLPESYKTDAESELQTKAEEYFLTVCRPQPKYTLTIEPIALKHIVGDGSGDTEIFKVGDLINISDPTGGVESATIRIDQFVRNLLNPYDYKLTLTDEVTYSQQIRTLIDVQNIKRTIEESKIYDVNRIRRGWKDAEELYNQIFDTEGHYYSEKIAPLSIDTQMLKVGARSQQLVLQNVLFQPNYNANPANLQISAGKLVHYTIAESDIKTWTISALSASNVPSTAQYVYAKCAKNGTTGTWLVTDQAVIFDSDPSYYHFIVGSLSSVDSASNTRNFAATYGFSTINGRNITTGVIKSADGSGVIIDLDAGTITGNITFNAAQGSANYDTIQSLINGNSKVNTASTNASSALSTANNANTNATNALNSINNLEIGGRNFLRNSAEMKVLSSGKAAWRASGGTLTHVTISNKPLNALTGAVRCANNGSTIVNIGMAQDYVNDTDRFKFNVGENYIQSYWVRGHSSFFDNIPSNIVNTGATYTYDEYTDTYLLTSTQSGDVNTQTHLRNAFREVNYLYLSGKSVRISVDITSSNTANKPRWYLYDMNGTSLATKDLSQGHNEWTITFPTIASGHTVGLILRMHQYNYGGSVAVGDTCKFANLRIVRADNAQYNYPQPIWQTGSQIPTTDIEKTYPTHQWQRVEWGGELQGTQADAYSAGYTYCTNMPVGGWFEVCAMKLEKGTKATDWTPAPEDVEAEILAEKTRLDNIDSDSVFSIAEKQVFRNEWFTISGIADTSTAGATIVANSAYKNGSLYQSYNSCPHATTLRTELLTAFNNLRTYLNTCGLYTNSDYTSNFNKATLQNYLATYYTTELNLQKYKENVGKLVGTCETIASDRGKIVVCPELTADMLVDTDMRMTIKFTNDNTGDSPYFHFVNEKKTTYQDSDYIEKAKSNWVNLYFDGSVHNSSSDITRLLYWVAGMEIEFKYYQHNSSNLYLQMVDEANYKTIMTYSKAIQGSTSIIGGLILTEMIQVGSGTAQAGMNGTSGTDVAFWAGGSVGNANSFNVPVVIKRDGNAKMGLLMIGNDGKLYFKDSGSERFLITNDNVTLNSGAKIYNTGNENGNDSYETFGVAIASGTSVTTTRTNYVIKSISTIPNASSGVKYNNVTIKVHAEMGMVASTAGTGGYATIGLEIYDGSSWREVTSFTKAFRTGGETGEWAYPISNDYTFIYNSATLSSNKAVIGLRAFAYCDSAAGSVTCAITGVKWCYYQDLTKNKTIIGKNGLGVMLNSTNIFQCTHTNDTTLTTTIKGKTDIPGVLWAGKVLANGTTTTTTTANSNAGRSVACSLSDTSLFTLALSGFTSAPTPIATVEFPSDDTANGWSANIVSVTEYQIKIRIRKDNSNKAAPFHLVLFGTN